VASLSRVCGYLLFRQFCWVLFFGLVCLVLARSSFWKGHGLVQIASCWHGFFHLVEFSVETLLAGRFLVEPLIILLASCAVLEYWLCHLWLSVLPSGFGFTPQHNLGRVSLFSLLIIWWFRTLFFFGTGTGSWGSFNYSPIQLGLSCGSFSVAFLVDWCFIWTLDFFSTNTTWCFFWLGSGSMLAAFFFFFFYACWWLSRLHNLQVGSKLRLENSGLVQRSVLGAVFLVCGGIFWCRLSFAWWSVLHYLFLLPCRILSLLGLSSIPFFVILISDGVLVHFGSLSPLECLVTPL